MFGDDIELFYRAFLICTLANLSHAVLSVTDIQALVI